MHNVVANEPWPAPPSVIWQDVECGGYEADLPIWRDLAGRARGPILDLGSGCGRVGLDLASRGAAVTCVDVDSAAIAVLRNRSGIDGVRIDTAIADARRLNLGLDFRLVIAPMQFIQLMGGPTGRGELFAAVAAHIELGGILAVAISDPLDLQPALNTGDEPALLPDIREIAGWVFSSQPLDGCIVESDAFEFRRRRVAVAPSGALGESIEIVRLDRVTPSQLAREARVFGFARPRREVGHHIVPACGDYVGSEVVVLEYRGGHS